MPDLPDLSIIGPKPQITTPASSGPPAMREFGDALATRKNIYDSALAAANSIEPVSNDRHTLRLTGVQWMDPERYTRKRRKEAVIVGDTLARRMRGTWELIDNATGDVIQKRTQVVGAVPYLTSLGTFTHNGTEYTVNHQQRLRAGVYARVKDNGELESHVNVLPGQGVSHRYFLDPEKGIFKIRLGQSEMPLMPLLRAMGTTDAELRNAWGNELTTTNSSVDDPIVIKKLASKILRRDEQGGDEPTARRRIAAAFSAMRLDPEVTSKTLNHPYDSLSKEAILAATKKLLAIGKREQDPDDRDHLAFQSFFGPEDLFSERIKRDHGYLRRGLLRKMSMAGSLDKMPSGALTPQIEQVLMGSGLASSLEEINPLEVLDKQSRITRLGEGGIPSTQSIPAEARSVQPSYLNFVDTVRTPESERAGVDMHAAVASRKGADGRLYSQFRDRSGNLVWKSPQDLLNASVTTSDVLKWDTKRVPVIKDGKLDYVPKHEIDYVVPEFEKSFSHLANLVPLKSTVKAQRMAMASRMLTQALPLVHPEAPLLQTGIPGANGEKSYEEDYGRHAGAVRADKPGRVTGIEDGVIKLQHDDGTTSDIELYQNHPMNRKTLTHQTPMVRPGDRFNAGTLLAKSNFTDDSGTTAVGANFRVAYLPYKGYNFEDAVVISESAAERMRSEHAYQFGVDLSPKHRVGKKSFIPLFPSKYDKETLSRMDDNGIIKVGETVEHGQPLILSAKERDTAQNKIHKRGQPGYVDESIVWDHHDTGIVTDVVHGRNGPVVLVKSTSPMRVGDKLSGRYGDKGVVSAVIPDRDMPHGEDNQPFEVLLSPDGLISRTNAAQTLEAALGKISRKTGKPYKVPDFETLDDAAAWVTQELKKHGLKDTETVTWPDGSRVPGVGAGSRFLMKLHHMAEAKAQGRSSGAYDTEDAPAKGGPTGCFVGDTGVRCFLYGGGDERDVRIKLIAESRLRMTVPTVDSKSAFEKTIGHVTNWFGYVVKSSELVDIVLDNGKTITCTKAHEFVLSDGSRRSAGDLKAGIDLMEA